MRRFPVVVTASLLFAACQDAPDGLTGPGDAAANRSLPVQLAPQASGHIVLLDPALAPGGHVANRSLAVDVAREHGVTPDHAYGAAVFGFSGVVPDGRLRALERDPRVARVEAVEAWELAQQATPTGVDRMEVEGNPTVTTDGTGTSVGLDIAIVDTGISDHEDLSIGQRVSFAGGDGTDGNGHGTHVAGTAAALDNGVGVVGAAPGATVHGAKVCKNGGICLTGDIVAGIDWVAARKADFKAGVAGGIDFASANMSIGTSDEGFTCADGDAGAVHHAICGAVSEGVVFVIAAGNDGREKTAYPEAFAVSAIADFDGTAGGAASPTCRTDQDDTRAGFSNWGAAVDVAAPGTCIRSTWNDGGYNTISGTSMAAPHATGAVALYLHANGLSPASDAAGVDAIEQAILDAAIPYGTADHQCSYDNDSADQSTEPLLFANATAFGGDGSCEVATSDGGGDGGGDGGDGGDGGATGGDMYVWDMGFAQKNYGPGGSFKDLTTTVAIRADSDADGVAESGDDPAADASVAMTLIHDTDGDGVFECNTEDDCWSFSGTTGSGGEVGFTLKRAPTGAYQAEVTDLTHSSLTWNQALDADNPDTYTLQ